VLRIDFGEWTHFEWYVPTTQGHHRYLQFAVKQTSGVNRLLFRLRYWTYLRWLFHGRFNDQDARVVEMMQTPPEQLYRPDNSIVAWRKLCEQAHRQSSATRSEPHAMTLDIEQPEEQPELIGMPGAKND
jgi:hypothetical protein